MAISKWEPMLLRVACVTNLNPLTPRRPCWQLPAGSQRVNELYRFTILNDENLEKMYLADMYNSDWLRRIGTDVAGNGCKVPDFSLANLDMSRHQGRMQLPANHRKH